MPIATLEIVAKKNVADPIHCSRSDRESNTVNLYNVERTRLPHLPTDAAEKRRSAANVPSSSKRSATAVPAVAAAQIRQRVRSMPPLPSPIGTLLRLVNDPDVEFKEIAKTISMDETLTAQLLRIANSAFYGFPQQIRTVQQATVIVGRHAVRNLALSLAMVKVRSHMKGNGPLAPEDFWRHSMAVAFGARMLTEHQRIVTADEAFVAGLLHDIGKVVFVEYDPQTYGELLQKARDGIAPLHVLERETFGIDHAEVGDLLCRHWTFPDVLGTAVASHHGTAVASRHEAAVASHDGSNEPADETARHIVDIVNVADALAKISRIGNGGSAHLPVAWLSRSHTFAEMPGRLLKTFSDLGEEVAANQQMFLDRPTVRIHTTGRGGRKHAVHVAIDDLDLRTLVDFVARSHRCDVVSADAEAPDLVVTDGSLDATRRSDLEQRKIAVVDVASWQREQASGEWIHIDKLHAWLAEKLAAATTSGKR